MSVGEFPNPVPHEGFPQEGEGETRSAPATGRHQYAQPELLARNARFMPAQTDPITRYRQESLDKSAGEPVELILDPIPAGSKGALLRWIIHSVEQNSGHAQPILDAALERAMETGMSTHACSELARQAIAQFAHERGRF